MPANVYTGKNLYFEFQGQSYGPGYKTVTITETQNTADSTAGSDDYETTIGTTKTLEISVSCLDRNNTAGSAIRSTSRIGNKGTVIIGPEGTATGKPKYSAFLRVSNVNRPFEHKTETKYDVTFVTDVEADGAGWLENYDDDPADVF
jgi:hypothetical protein